MAYRAFLQWIADTQLARAACSGNLYRDLALGSAFDGGEIAESPDDYAHGVSIGAPPDPFSREGQVWNLPPLSPLALAERRFQPLRDVMLANMRHAAALRIDHVLGFMRQFWVPRGAEGKAGAYVNFPIDGMIAVTAIESRRQNCMVIGEDLGTIPDGLRERLNAARILSYRVLWFERDGIRVQAARPIIRSWRWPASPRMTFRPSAAGARASTLPLIAGSAAFRQTPSRHARRRGGRRLPSSIRFRGLRRTACRMPPSRHMA